MKFINPKKIYKNAINLFILLTFICSFIVIPNRNNKNEALEDTFVLIPKGAININDMIDNQVEGSSRYGINDNRDPKIEVDSFYICKYEVSNIEYKNLLNYFLLAKDTEEYKKLYPDTSVWIRRNNYQKEYAYLFTSPGLADYYFQHSAYNEHPVVGITHKQAELYCKWLTKLYHENPKRRYKKVLFRLPRRSEWEYAAFGGQNKDRFPWKGNKMMDEKGNLKANFNYTEQYNIRRGEFPLITSSGPKTKEITFCIDEIPEYFKGDVELIKPIKSYQPGSFGTYNMAGNVEEMIAEDYLTKGGSWYDTGYYLQNKITELYDSTNLTSAERGFRIVMDIIQK